MSESGLKGEPISSVYPSKLKQKAKFKDEYKVIIYSIIAALSAYVIDAEVDAFIFHEGSFLDQLILAVPMAEVYFRLYLLASFIIFGIFFSRILAKRKKAEEALRESEERFRDVAANTGDWIWEVDANGKYTYASPMVEQVLGYTPKEVLRKHFYDFFLPDEREHLKKAAFEVFARRERFANFVNRNLHKNGYIVILETSGVPILGTNGHLLGYRGVDRNITERKVAEESLRESEERFRKLSESTSEGIVIHDKGKILDANQTLAKMFGYEFSELIGKQGLDLVASGFRDLVSKNIQSGYEKPYEATCLKRDGSTFPVEICGTAIHYKGRMCRVVIIRDITEQKRMGEEKKRYEERLSALNFYGGKLNIANSFQQVYELTLDAMENTLGFEEATFMVAEKGILKVVCYRGYSRSITIELPLDGTKKGISVRTANARKPMLVSDVSKDEDYVEGVPDIRSELAVPVISEDKVLGVLDVESRKTGAFDEKDATLLQILASHAATAISNLIKREEIVKRSSQLASLMKSSAEMIHSTDLRQRLQTTAEAIRDLGWRRVVISVRDENMEMRSPEDMVTVGLTDEERESLWKNRPPGQEIRERYGPEYERFKIGEFYYLPWSDPWVRERVAEMFTISSHLKSEEMIDWNPDDLLYGPLRLADGRIVGRLSIDDPLDGKRPTKESLAPLELFLHQAAVAIENARLIQQLNDVRKQVEEYADLLELKVKQRTQELMETQNKLLKSERLAAIGEIAAMVGHDLRNPLTGIAGATYYLKMKTSSKMDKKTKEMLELIEEDIEYSNKIINDLLEYSKEIQLELIETTPKMTVKETLSLVEVPKNIQMSDSTQTEPKIKIDAEKMKRVFINIIKNAIDAMPKGGKLTITSKKADGNLKIAFTDTGIGMPKNVVEKLWTPLFTTKAKGMGLGLAVCKRIVEAHGGNISVESTVGKGTTFTVTIPIQPRLEEGGEKIWVKMPESLLSTTTKA